MKDDSDSLIVRQLLVSCGLGELFTSEALEAEQACCISFIDGDFQVTGGIKECQFGTFGNVCISFADLADDLISSEEDAELPVFALSGELFAGDIYDHIFEAVDMDDLSFDEVVADEWLQVVFYDNLLRKRRQLAEGGTPGKFACGGGQQLYDSEGIAWFVFSQWYFDDLFGHPSAYHGQEAVIGATDILSVVFGDEYVIGSAVEEVDEHEVEGSQGEIGEGAFADIGSLREVERGDMVADVCHMTFRAVLPELPFDGTYQVILQTNVRC